MMAESAQKSAGSPLSFVQSVPAWVSPCTDRPCLPELTLSIVLSIWWKPMWLLPIRVQVSIIWMVTKLIWKTIMSNNIFFLFCSHLTVGQCVCMCVLGVLVLGLFLYKNVIRKILLFLKTLCKYRWWKLTFVVRRVFICHLNWWRKQWYSW